MEIDIAGQDRARYMEHTPAYAPTAREDKGDAGRRGLGHRRLVWPSNAR